MPINMVGCSIYIRSGESHRVVYLLIEEETDVVTKEKEEQKPQREKPKPAHVVKKQTGITTDGSGCVCTASDRRSRGEDWSAVK